jgi:hypothetical protein
MPSNARITTPAARAATLGPFALLAACLVGGAAAAASPLDAAR